ncbi:hypothetical protein HY004_02475 [Candidatus Saccharibacteria bacterium]|nr:hypothetical protein [Candidatus Saccharibacteria bacterium]
MKRFLLGIFMFGLLVGLASFSTPTYALDNGAESGFKTGLDESGGGSEKDCVNAGGKVSGDKCVDANGHATNAVSLMIKNIINLLIYIAGIIAVIIIVIAGMRFVTSNGDSGATSKARNEIIYAVVGLVIAIMAYALVNFILINI